MTREQGTLNWELLTLNWELLTGNRKRVLGDFTFLHIPLNFYVHLFIVTEGIYESIL
jgi:hypothetical protein